MTQKNTAAEDRTVDDDLLVEDYDPGPVDEDDEEDDDPDGEGTEPSISHDVRPTTTVMTDGGRVQDEDELVPDAPDAVAFDPDAEPPTRNGRPSPAYVGVSCDDCGAAGTMPERLRIEADNQELPVRCERCNDPPYQAGDRVLVVMTGPIERRVTGTVEELQGQRGYVVALDGAGEAHVTADCLLDVERFRLTEEGIELDG